MGDAELSPDLRKLLEERKLLRMKPDPKLIAKEIESAEFDLGSAKNSFEAKNFKWATIQGYYSMFHSARALVLENNLKGTGFFSSTPSLS